MINARRQARPRDDADRARAGGAACPSRRCSRATTTIEGAEAWADSALQDGVRQFARYAIGAGQGGDGDASCTRRCWASRRTSSSATVPVIRPVVLAPDAHQGRDRAGLPGGAARPARPRRRAARAEGVIGGEHPNAADFQVAPSRAADAELRPAARAHRRATRRRARPPARARITRAGSGKCSRTHGFRSETRLTLGERDRRLALAPRGRDRLRRARPRPLAPCATSACPPTRSASPRPASPRCCSTTATSAPAAASRASCSTSSASSRTGAPRSPSRAGSTGSSSVGLFGSSLRRRARDRARGRASPRVAAAVAQCPMTDGLQAALLTPQADRAEARPSSRCRTQLGSRLGRKPKLIKAAGKPGERRDDERARGTLPGFESITPPDSAWVQRGRRARSA